VQGMQEAARQAAQGQNSAGLDPNHPGQALPQVPNGLTPGGLEVAPGVPKNLAAPAPGENPKLWQGADLPEGAGNNVSIRQQAPQAILTWKTFNVGKDTTVTFDQSHGTQKDGSNDWIAFNKVLDPTGVPSQILGSIRSDGTVYIINQNGIIFGGASQVNVRSLVASSLPINDNLIARGLLNNPDGQFLFSALALPAGPNTPAFTPPLAPTPSTLPGDVTVQPGATITTPTAADHTGGRVALVGPNVTNSGTISTPDGQTILAAGLQVGFAAHPSADATLRGLDVYVGAVTLPAAPVGTPGGTATNDGLIEIPRASVVITGRNVNQLGVIDSSTTVSLNGRIDLLADYNAVGNLSTNDSNVESTGGARNLDPFAFLPQSSGTVTIGSGSVMQILPDYSSTEKVVGVQLPLNSQVNIQGQAIDFQSKSLLLAPSANVTVSAGTWKFLPGNTPVTNFLYSGGQIYFDSQAMINVAGSTDVSVPISENILAVGLRGAELADMPLQRNGLFRGLTVTVDARQQGVYNGVAWVGTPLANVSGYVGLIQRSVGELTVAGGTVTMKAGESVITQPGSMIDVSGGYIQYQGGMVRTTRVLAEGHVLDISQVTPDMTYDGIYTGTVTESHPKYGISQTFSQPLALMGEHFEQSYTYGGNGGSITISAPSMALDGNLLGQTIAGPRQRSLAPAPSSLSIAFQAQDTTIKSYPFFSPTPPQVVFQDHSDLLPAAAFALDDTGSPVPLRADRVARVVLSPSLLAEGGFGNLSVDNSDGEVLVPEGVSVVAPAGGSIAFKGANITISGKVAAPAGSLKFETSDFSKSALNNQAIAPIPVTPDADLTRGNFTLGRSAELSAAGTVVDDRPGTLFNQSPPLLQSGGSITISGLNVDMQSGGLVDVSGGVLVSQTGRKTYGNAGTITINAGQDLGISSVLGGQLVLESTLKGFSGAKGGTLNLQAPFVQIGGAAQFPRTLLLDPQFFSQGGFATFSIKALGGTDPNTGEFLPAFVIAPGTDIAPVATSYIALTDASSVTLRPVLEPVGVRTPVSLSFTAAGVTDLYDSLLIRARGDFVMGEGASIRTDPQTDGTRGVAITGNTVSILGSIVAPGGTISITGRNTGAILNLSPNQVLPNVYLGPHSFLSTAGATVLVSDPRGFRTGTVLPGGTITVSGNIVAEAGAVLDVSGTSGVLDLPPTYSTLNPLPARPLNGTFLGYQVVPTRVDSNGGSIILTGDQMLFVDATLRGFAGGPTALGGSLSVSSKKFVGPADPPVTPADPNLVVTQSGPTIPIPGQAGIGKPVLDANGNPLAGMGYFAADTFLNGGFDSLSLGGVVRFSGPVSITARRSLQVATGGFIYGDAPVRLQAPYVALGTPFQVPLDPTQGKDPFQFGAATFNIAPSFGPGSLTVVAQLIDIGNLSLQNIGRASLIADGGDIRGNGTFDLSGQLYLRAGQIYPTTASAFTISVYDPNIAVIASSTASNQVTLASASLPPGFGVGSPLLGSTVASINGAIVTLQGNANASITAQTAATFAPGEGSVIIAGSGNRDMPLSAGGTLSIYASNINQGGVLRAPLGTINIGWNGDGTGPKDLISGQAVAVAQQVTLGPGSVTSVSALNPTTGAPLLIPYGLNLNGTSWIDPTGIDITATGVPAKSINIGGVSVTANTGSLIDIRGGGDLYAYRWVDGTGGTADILGQPSGNWDARTSYAAGTLVSFNGQTYSARQANTGLAPSSSTAWLVVPKSYAVIPGYQADFAPYAPFNSTSTTGNLGGDPGFTQAGLSVGDRVYLGASSGLPAGDYTLLPARYALLPGAFLITPQSGAPLGTQLLPSGDSYVSGYIVNSLNGQRTGQPLSTRFEVSSFDMVRQRAQYDDFSANTFFPIAAQSLGLQRARLPDDGGSLVIKANLALGLDGSIMAAGIHGDGALSQFRDGQIEISTKADILIAGGGVTGGPGVIVLDAGKLSSYGAESLLIGGFRQSVGADGTTVTVTTPNITIDNAGSPLSVPDLILVANQTITLAPDAAILQSGPTLHSLENFLIGNAATPGSGNGVALRVGGDTRGAIIRSGVSQSAIPALTVGAGAQIVGSGLTLDSTNATSLSPTALIAGTIVNLNSGQISLLLDNPGVIQPTVGLVLSGPALQALQSSAQTLSLLSYSSIDFYGTGTIASGGTFALRAGEFRTFNNGGGVVSINADDIFLDNRSNGSVVGPVSAPSGTIAFNANTIRLGSNLIQIDQASTVELNASQGLLLQGTGSLVAQGAITINTPLITGAEAVTYTLQARGGPLTMQPQPPAVAVAPAVTGGLGANISLLGTSVIANTDILLSSGILNVRATAGDLTVGGRFDVGGTSQAFNDLTRYTDGGQIHLSSDTGSVTIDATSVLNVAAQAGGGNAGSIAISAPLGVFTLSGAVAGKGGVGGAGGTFALDTGSILGNSVSPLDATLDAGGFTQSRTYRVRTGNITVDGLATAHHYSLSADTGDITVTAAGRIDASGVTGGTISLVASRSLILQSGSVLTVAAQNFSDAGKGGAVSLEAGAETNGTAGPTTSMVDLQTGATIDLSVASNTAGSAALGQFTGTLHLRAPQNAAGTDLQVATIGATILAPSLITIEGYKVYTPAGGTLDANLLSQINANGTAFIGDSSGNASATYNSMVSRIFGADPQGLYAHSVIVAGAEVVNLSGNLTLGTSTSTGAAGDWNMAALRFGPKLAAGVLTLRARDNLVFLNTLSDGFTNGLYNSALLNNNLLLPANGQSWSYRLAAGADFTGADFRDVRPLSTLGGNLGSVLLGRDNGTNISNSNGSSNTPGANATTSLAISTASGTTNRFQVIRTGSGEIDVVAGRDVKFLNEFATIYTAGTRVTDPNLGGTFDTPILSLSGTQGNLGAIQQTVGYPAQYTLGGGNVTITAQHDIIHQTLQSGTPIDDSSKELPINWLDRRGFVDPVTGLFGTVSRPGASDIGSTTWWVDFSNFFEGVGALGGGNVTLIAGNDVKNVDAVIPTNARMPGKDATTLLPIAPNASSLVELGGGDLIVHAGHDINGGVYYVERGNGNLSAGDVITTNSTRSPSRGAIVNEAPTDSHNWLPTTLFLGKGSFQVSALGDVLLGPVANPFLLPEGYNNTFWYKTYFSTYAPTSEVDVTSVGGNVTLREASAPTTGTLAPPVSLLSTWLDRVDRLVTASPLQSVSFYQPWLRLDEDSVVPFRTSVALLPPTLRVTAFTGDIDTVGNLTLSPASSGTIDLLAAGSINGLQPNGISNINNVATVTWGSSRINLSDADPANIPGISDPLAFRSTLALPNAAGTNRVTGLTILDTFNALFQESGATTGSTVVLETKQALHGAGPLHVNDPNPVHLYADGDISGLTLFSGKPGTIVAGNDVTDIAFYLQNVNNNQVSVVSAGRDIVAYDANSVLRSVATQVGNASDGPLAGDIQISGPGTLEVLAGRNIDLGTGASLSDGTGTGITSVGNARNPFLPFGGAGIIVGAGMGQAASGLAESGFDFASFVDKYLGTGGAAAGGHDYFAELQASLGSDVQLTPEDFKSLPPEVRAQLSLQLFYLILRDSGRDHNNPASPSFGSYANGFAAITSLFPSGGEAKGDIETRARDIRTKSGGSIDIFAPNGNLELATSTIGTPQVPPGIVTEAGGGVGIFTNGSVDIGISRIFTLRGGDIVIWSSTGNIAAGSSPKTVQSAPPTRVVIDPQTGNVSTDLAGLATGGGIGVLATVANVPPGNVDLIAPAGVVDAGDAGIRATGNLNIAATKVLNADNIQVAGTSTGTPVAAPVAAPNLGALGAGSQAQGAADQAADQVAKQNHQEPPHEDAPSFITVEVLGYGGGEGSSEGDAGTSAPAPPQ